VLKNEILMTTNFNFSQSSFTEVNFEVRDTDYFGLEINSDNLIFEINFTPYYKDINSTEIFLHTRYYIEHEKDKKISIFHADYVSSFELSGDMLQKQKNKTLIPLNTFYKLLGITISMSRGYFLARTIGHQINDFPFPILDPLKFTLESPYIYNDEFLKLEME